MNRNRIFVLAFGLFLIGFLFCGGTGLLINKLMRESDTGSQARATTPTIPVTTAPRPTEPVKPTVPKTVPKTEPKATEPKATKPVPTVVEVPRDPNIPADAELRQLVANTLSDIDGAIKKKDVTAWHSKMSAKWQADGAKQNLLGIIRNIKISVAPVRETAMVFSPAAGAWRQSPVAQRQCPNQDPSSGFCVRLRSRSGDLEVGGVRQHRIRTAGAGPDAGMRVECHHEYDTNPIFTTLGAERKRY